MRTMTKTNRAAWALLALVVALAAGCNEATKVTLPAAAKSDGQASVAAADPIEVSVTTATEARVDAPIRVSGHLEPLRAVTLGSDVTGRIVEIPVKEGDHVEKGDLLVRLLSERCEALVNEFRASYRYVILTAPAVLEHPEPILLGSRADGAILVVRAEREGMSEVNDACRMLRGLKAKIHGTVLAQPAKRKAGGRRK